MVIVLIKTFKTKENYQPSFLILNQILLGIYKQYNGNNVPKSKSGKGQKSIKQNH